MALLSRKVDYALLVLSYLHHRAEGGCARAIAARFALSRAFVANILKLLCRKGFVRGQRGMRGGYVLQRRASEVCLCELVEALDGPFRLAECNRRSPGLEEGACALVDVCPVRDAIAEVDRRLREVLRTVTLADLFRPAAVRPETGQTQFGLEVGLGGRAAQLASADG
jgi:Rrf2 family protein